LQLASSAAFSLGHGGNDAQKVMGIIGAAVIFHEVQIGNPAYTSLPSAERFFSLCSRLLVGAFL
jgi:PiT family inorganic phosphate transporter